MGTTITTRATRRTVLLAVALVLLTTLIVSVLLAQPALASAGAALMAKANAPLLAYIALCFETITVVPSIQT